MFRIIHIPTGNFLKEYGTMLSSYNDPDYYEQNTLTISIDSISELFMYEIDYVSDSKLHQFLHELFCLDSKHRVVWTEATSKLKDTDIFILGRPLTKVVVTIEEFEIIEVI